MSLLPKRDPVDIEFSNLSYIVPTLKANEKKTILKNVSGKFASGRLTAIMGPSGAGKTTLMNITAGYRLSYVEGQILINGEDRHLKSFKKKCCYIMQDDHHLPHLTVMEIMLVAANLKLSPSITKDKKNEIIMDILMTLSLNECQDTRTSNLSGGQEKRLSIALELVNNPPVMFFDEPTSGLDSQNSLQCINLLQSLAAEGRTVVCTIHQPSARIFEMFDCLYALASGECIYRGLTKELLLFLSSINLHCPSFHNPADYLIEVAAGEEYAKILVAAVLDGKCQNLSKDHRKNIKLMLSDKNKNSLSMSDISGDTNGEGSPFIINGNVVITMDNEKQNGLYKRHNSNDGMDICQTSLFYQFIVLMKRNYISIMRDALLTKLRIAMNIIVGLLMGVLYFGTGNEASKIHSNNGFLFVGILFSAFAGMMPTLLTFPMEMKVFVREHHNRWYSLKAYYLAKTTADIPFQILYPSIFVFIVYFMTNQPLEVSRFCMFGVMNIMTSLVFQSYALLMGAYFDLQEATFFAPVMVIPILMFSGFFVTYSTIPYYLRWIVHLSMLWYPFEGTMISIYGYGRAKLDCSLPYCHFKVPSKMLQMLEVTDGNYLIDFGAMVIFFFILRIGGYFVLRWKIRKER